MKSPIKTQHIDRLAEDHANARWLAERLAQLPGLTVYPETIETNILFLEPTDRTPEALRDALLAHGVAVNAINGRVRLVTHADLDRPMLECAVAILAGVVRR